jgi:hypothetical protein
MAHPWGLDELADSTGRYERPAQAKDSLVNENQPPALVLTEAGEVLIRRGTPQLGCVVALMIGQRAGALSRPQVERMQRAWDIALAVADGESEKIHFQPMPHHWRFSRVDYQMWDEWMSARGGGGGRNLNCLDGRGAQR